MMLAQHRHDVGLASIDSCKLLIYLINFLFKKEAL
jgi:hypothetical protein